MPSSELSYETLDDFSPGIVSRSNYALGSTAVPAQLGAAQQTNTFRCIALPEGGLGPLPKRGSTVNVTAPEASMTNVVDGYWITGFGAFGAIGGTADDLIVAVEYIFNNAGSEQRRHRLYRIRGLGANTDTIKSINSAQVAPVHNYNAVMTNPTRAHPTDPTKAGIPVMQVAWQAYGGGSEQYISLFPDPAAPTVLGVNDLTTTRYGHTLTHQGRIVLLEFVSYGFGNVSLMITNEQISFTDPPNSVTLTAAASSEVFVQEVPFGFGAWGSMNAGELFFVKRSGGAVLISGDIANPSVIFLPGVTSTGLYTNRAVSTRQGMLYATEDMGLQIWSGGDSSRKVSEQLDNSFLDYPGLPPFDASRWTSFASWGGDWIVMTNNWLWDAGARNPAWWRMDDTSVYNGYWWHRSFDGPTMYSVLPSFTNTSNAAITQWDRRTPATNFSWQSHPIPVSVNRVINVRELVLVAQGSGTVTVTLTALDGTTQASAFTLTNTSQPQRLRLTPAVKGYNIVVRIQSDGGSGAAPVVYSLQIGHQDTQKATSL